MSASSKTTSGSQTTNQTQTLTPSNPTWVTGGVSGIGSTLTSLAGQNPSSFVAGPNSLQTGAATSLTDPNLNDSWNYDGAANLYRGTAQQGPNTYTAATGQAASLLPNIDTYMSPYVKDVVNSSLADYNFGAGQQTAQQNLSLANDDTFGGSSGAIATAMNNDAINRGRASLVSGILNNGYTQAATEANEDADRQQQMTLANDAALNTAGQFNAGEADTAAQRQQAAAAGLVGLSGDQTQSQLSIDNAQSSLGQILQQIQEAQAGAPLSVASSLAGDWNSLPLSLFNGKTATGTGTTTGSSTTTGGGLSLGLTLPGLGGIKVGGGS